MIKPIECAARFARGVLRSSLLGMLCCGTPFVSAQVFPQKQAIRMVVPFAPGGGTDLIARVLGAGIATALSQTVIVDNKPGAGTMIGSEAVAKSPADGYTLLVATFAHAVNPSLQARMPYAQATAFTPVGLIGHSPNVLVVRADRPYKTVAELIAAARREPGKLTYGSFGSGTSAHLAAELFKSMAQVDLTHVPYRGSGPALTDLLGGQIDMMFSTAASVASYVQAGKLRAVALTSAQRSTAMPSVPTIAESGLPGYVAESWYAIYAPAGTPADVVSRLNAALRQAAASETFKKRVEDEGLSITASTPAELTRYVDAEQSRWQRVIKDGRITAD